MASDTSDAFIPDWLAQAQTLSLSLSSNTQDAARKNMLIFPIQDVRNTPRVEATLLRIISEYQYKAEAATTPGLFYAWVDEISGTFRCSFCKATSLTELPFACKLVTINQIKEIAALVTSCPYGCGIPVEELTPCQDWSEPQGGQEFILQVFVHPNPSPGLLGHEDSSG